MSDVLGPAIRAIFVAWLMSLSGVALAQDACIDTARDGDAAVREQYQHTIDFFLELAAAAQIKGIDPRRFPQADQNGHVEIIDLVDTAQQISMKRDEGIQAIYAAFQECKNAIQPYQRIIDTAQYFLFGGLQEVIPEQVTHIDAGRLLSGTPFGGPNALIPQARETILARLGIGGDAANIIRNPLQINVATGPVRLPWNPFFPGIPTGPIPAIGSIPLPQLPPLPAPPPPIQIGSIGGHRVCLPWC